MGKFDFVFASTIEELSEEKEYITLKNRVFFFNAPNLNGVQINYDDSSLDQCRSLINMPLVARYVKRDGKDDLGGHEVSVVDGKMQFGTQAIGVITDVQIVEEDVETCDGSYMKLPCLYATERVWNRFSNVVSAVKRLYSQGNLYNSWELKNNEYTYKDGIKYISSYTFLANCLLGTQSYPAYGKGGAKVLDISQVSDQYEYLAAEAFSEALTMDTVSLSASNINTNQLDDSKSDREEEKLMDANENVVVENSETVAEEEAVETVKVEETAEVVETEVSNSETPEVSESESVEDSESETDTEANAETDTASESSEGEHGETSEMLTDRDISIKIDAAYRKLDHDGYVAMLFPEEKIVLIKRYGATDLKYKQYSYRIDGDEVVLENEQDVELVISPLNVNSEIETKNNAIAAANNRIVELENQVAELNVFKQELDTIKAEQENTKHNEAVNKLRKFAVDSGRFTSEELDSDPVKSAIDNLNEAWIKAEVADRFVASLQKNTSEVDASEVKNDSISIVLSEEEKPVTSEDVMRAFFNN